MADENNNVQPTQNQEEAAILKAYKELQANSIPKEQYEKDINELKEKNNIYLKAITEGNQVDVASDDNSDNINDVISDMSKFKGTNLEYWNKMTKAIDKTLTALPEEEIIKITGTEGLEELVKVNQGMKSMVEDAKGDPDYFRTLYGQRVQDSAPRISNEIVKAGSLVNYLSNK